MAPALVADLPPFPGKDLNKLKVRQVRLLHLVPSGAVVEHGRGPIGRHLIDDLNAVRIRAQQRRIRPVSE